MYADLALESQHQGIRPHHVCDSRIYINITLDSGRQAHGLVDRPFIHFPHTVKRYFLLFLLLDTPRPCYNAQSILESLLPLDPISS